MQIHVCDINQMPETRSGKTRNQIRDFRNLCRTLILLHTRIVIKLPKLIEHGPFGCNSILVPKISPALTFLPQGFWMSSKTTDPLQKWIVFHAQMEFGGVLRCKIHLRHPILPLGWFKTGYLQNNQNYHGLK